MNYLIRFLGSYASCVFVPGKLTGRVMCYAKSRLRRVAVVVFYFSAFITQLVLWPQCENEDSSSLMEDLESKAAGEEFDLETEPLPSNPLDPPMWSPSNNMQSFSAASCGPWMKSYVDMHRDILNGDLPPSYLIYTTGQGFPPVIEGIPQALKGIGTVFLLALLTERAFILDWRFPAGFNRVLVPHYIDWRSNSLLGEEFFYSDPVVQHVHDIGSMNWFQSQNKSVQFYMETDFKSYFVNDREVVQSHSYDFTYALLRNKHFKERVKELGLHSIRCRLCCIWNFLFKFSSTFVHTSAQVAKKKLGLSGHLGQDLVFIDLSFPHERIPKKTLMREVDEILKCVSKIARTLQDPMCVMASNIYYLLEEVPRRYPSIWTNNGLFFSRERYQIELQQQQSHSDTGKREPANSHSSTGDITIPRTEQNALMHFFVGYFLQLNSTVIFPGRKSPYSESMLALRHFFHSFSPSVSRRKYVTRHERGCKLETFG